MLTVEDWMDIKGLHRQGHSIRTIAALTGYARNTVRRVLRQARPPAPQKRQRASGLDPFRPYLLSREAVGRLSAVRLLEGAATARL
jgi:transposase